MSTPRNINELLEEAILDATDHVDSAYGPFVEGYSKEIIDSINRVMEENDIVFYRP